MHLLNPAVKAKLMGARVEIARLEYYLELECKDCGTVWKLSGQGGDLSGDHWKCPKGCNASYNHPLVDAEERRERADRLAHEAQLKAMSKPRRPLPPPDEE